MKTTMPLPLELTRPVALGASLEESLKATFEAEKTTYNPLTQIRENAAGMPQLCGGGSRSNQESKSYSGILVIDVQLDLQVDDNDF